MIHILPIPTQNWIQSWNWDLFSTFELKAIVTSAIQENKTKILQDNKVGGPIYYTSS